MPLEGHYERVNTPLRKLSSRERKVARSPVLASPIAAILGAALRHRRRQPPLLDERPRAGCIEVAVAGRVGAEPISGCGAEAEEICATRRRFDIPARETIVAACDEAGVRF